MLAAIIFSRLISLSTSAGGTVSLYVAALLIPGHVGARSQEAKGQQLSAWYPMNMQLFQLNLKRDENWFSEMRPSLPHFFGEIATG